MAAKWPELPAEGAHAGSAQAQSRGSGSGDSDAHTAPRNARCCALNTRRNVARTPKHKREIMSSLEPRIFRVL